MTIKLFSREQLKHRDIDALKRQLRDKLGGYTVAIKDIAKNNLLYRGVVSETRPLTIRRVSYPPPENVKKHGRLNRAGNSMFYCSLGAPAVLYEMRAKQGYHIALSQWEVTENLWMHNVGYHEAALRRLGAPRIGSRLQLTQPIPNETRANAKLRRQLSYAFTEDVHDDEEYKYKLSIAINELLFDKAEPFPNYPNGPKYDRAAGTVYPAMRMRGVADNIAIKPEFVESSLRIKSVRYLLVEAINEEKSSYIVLNLAISNAFCDGKIVWQETLSDERLRRSHISLEGARWVSRNGFNEIYDMH